MPSAGSSGGKTVPEIYSSAGACIYIVRGVLADFDIARASEAGQVGNTAAVRLYSIRAASFSLFAAHTTADQILSSRVVLRPPIDTCQCMMGGQCCLPPIAQHKHQAWDLKHACVEDSIHYTAWIAALWYEWTAW